MAIEKTTTTPDEFRRSVLYFWRYKDDPTRYTGWSEARCRELMPEFYTAWQAYLTARSILNIVADAAAQEDHEDPI